MSENTPDLLDWSSEDTDNLRKFLITRSGSRLLPKLAESAPILFADGDTNRILVRNGELRGFQSALRELMTLANPPPEIKSEANEYPSLLDDSAWNDGQKIVTSTPAPQ